MFPSYFKRWDAVAARECCFLSEVTYYEPNQVVLGDGCGSENMVYFVLEGECVMIEHLLVYKNIVRGKVEYRVFDPNEIYAKSRRFSVFQRRYTVDNSYLTSKKVVNDDSEDSDDEPQRKFSLSYNITTTFRAKPKKPWYSSYAHLPPQVEVHFMQVG